MATERDPVCGMLVRPEQAAQQRSHEGRTYYFCSAACAARFDQAPQRYLPQGGDGKGGPPTRGAG